MTALEPGSLLDRRYRVVQILAKGGFGQTYIAEDTRRPGNPICVVKHLKPASHDSIFLENARRLFATEAETLERLGSHDQIPRLLAYFEEDQEFYLVQDLIRGQTLNFELQPGQIWSEAQIVQMLQDVLNVLVFVHGSGVIHRDIKPDNLIRRRQDGKLVLVDFGAVKQIRSPQQMALGGDSITIAVGTPGYMPTEQNLGKPRPNSDLYALGIIGIRAATGLLPSQFEEDPDTGEIVWQRWTQVSSDLNDILVRMVRYHFKDRYQSAIEVLQAIDALVSQDPDLAVAVRSTPLLPSNVPFEPRSVPFVPTEFSVSPPEDVQSTVVSVDFIPAGEPIAPQEQPQPAAHSSAVAEAESAAPPQCQPEPTAVLDSSEIQPATATQFLTAASQAAPARDLPASAMSSAERLPTTLPESEGAPQVARSFDRSAATEVFPAPASPAPPVQTGVTAPHSTQPTIVVSPKPAAEVPITTVTQRLNAPASPVPISARLSSRSALIAAGVVAVVLAVGISNFSRMFSSSQELNSVTLARSLPCPESALPALSGTPDYEYPDGTKYYGPIASGKPADGRVTMLFPSGNRYDGEFRNGQRNGCGTFSFTNFGVYVGQFQDNQLSGQGVLMFENGDRYIGSFQDGKCHGEGTFILADGTIRNGNWRNGDLIDGDLSCNSR